jgi:hypothetical protein
LPALPLHPNCECEYAPYSGDREPEGLDPELQAIVDEYETNRQEAVSEREIDREQEERLPVEGKPAAYEPPSKAKTASGRKLRAAQKERREAKR